MRTRIIIGALLLAAGIGIGATTQPSGSIQELRARRAELEKQIAAATAELKAVNAAIVKAGAIEKLPHNFVEENAKRWDGEGYGWISKVKFGPMREPATPEAAKDTAVVLPMQLPSLAPPQPVTVTAVALATGRDNTAFTAPADGALTKTGVIVYYKKAEAAFAGLSPRPRLSNIHVAVDFGGVRAYECLMKYDGTAQIAPRGVRWWCDTELLVAPSGR
jgi:outer membrane murein-binding lipoprotein Lpp